MKRLYFLILLPFLLYADRVEVTSEYFYAKDSEKQAHFIDNVLVKQGKSWIHSDKLIVYFNDNNETIQYDAIGKATFEVFENASHYKGEADKVSYYPQISEYLFAGKAVIHDIDKDRHIKGNIIVVNTITGDADVKGDSKKPIIFIFHTEKK